MERGVAISEDGRKLLALLWVMARLREVLEDCVEGADFVGDFVVVAVLVLLLVMTDRWRMGMSRWEIADIPSSISAFAIQRFAKGRDGVDVCCGSAETHLFSLSLSLSQSIQKYTINTKVQE